MEIKDWIELVGRFGLPIVALMAFGWMVWSFVTKEIESGHAQRRAEFDKFMETLARRDDQWLQAQREVAQALHAVSESLQVLRTEVLQQKAK